MNTLSPWLEETEKLGIKSNYAKLNTDISTDVLVIGGGIAGISTAYFLLTTTNKRIILVEGNKIVSGATGNNAGYVGGGFEEKSLKDLIKEFGEKAAVKGYKDLEDVWGLIDEMAQKANIPNHIFMQKSATGDMDIKSVFPVIEDRLLRKRYGLKYSEVFIAKEALIGIEVPERYKGEFNIISHEEVLEIVRTKDKRFIAVYKSDHIGSMNSAKFCTYILNFLAKTYPQRINIFENSFIQKITLDKDKVTALSNNHSVTANQIVLCTNGYTNFKLEDELTGLEYTYLKDSISPLIQYMIAFKEDSKDFYSGSYHEKGHSPEAAYYYLSKRPFQNRCLTTIGGEDRTPQKNEIYNPNEQVPENALIGYKEFVDRMWEIKKEDFDYKWQGLLGYTPNRTRWIGRDSIYPNLIYNLGCNGKVYFIRFMEVVRLLGL
jgi:glycine/D-amino acid oxidase-like deaminating enzyme